MLVICTLKKYWKNSASLSGRCVLPFFLRKKKSSGKWYFYCLVPGCTASLKAQYVDDTEEPEFRSCDTAHNLKGGGSHEPNEVTRLVESTGWLIKEGIQANLHEKV